MSTKDTSFHSFFAFFSLLEKTETLDKKGDPHTKKGPRRTPISRRGPIWEQCKCWKPFLGVYLQLSSMLSRLWSEWGTGQDGGARPKFLQGKVCHCFANLLWFFSNVLPLAVSQHLMAACQCQNKSPAHFLLQIIAIFQSQFLKCGAKKDQMKKMKIFKRQFPNFFNAANKKIRG